MCQTAKEFWNRSCFKSNIKRVFTIILVVALLQLSRLPYMDLNNVQKQESFSSVASIEKILKKQKRD